MADHETVTKTVITRAWNDLEPKVVAYLTGAGILTAASVVYGYLFPDSPVPFWLPIVVTYVGGFIAQYLKKSSVPVVAPVSTDGVADVSSLPVVTAPAEPVSTDATYSPDAP